MCKESLIDFDKYEITKDGKIFSKYYNRYLNGCIENKGRYVVIGLKCIDGKNREFYLQRVIWHYFNGEIPEGMQVNHIDECKTNNVLSNLNLMTPRQNTNWGTRNQRISFKKRNNPYESKPLGQIDLTTGEIIATFPSAREAARQLGFSQANISRCCNGGYYDKRYNKWTNLTHSHGYGWKYI